MRNRGSKNEWTNIFKNKANAVWRKINGQTFPKTAKCSLEKKTNGQTFRKTDKSTFRKTQMDKHFKKQYTRDRNKCNNKCYKQFAPPPPSHHHQKRSKNCKWKCVDTHPTQKHAIFCPVSESLPPPPNSSSKKGPKKVIISHCVQTHPTKKVWKILSCAIASVL